MSSQWESIIANRSFNVLSSVDAMGGTVDAASSCLDHSLDGLLLILLGVDLGDGGGSMAKDNAGGFDAELLSKLRGGVVAELVRMPTVALPPVYDRLIVPLGQRLRRREGLVAGALDRPTIATRRVAITD